MFVDGSPNSSGITQSLIAAGSGLIGVAIGGLITAYNQSATRKKDAIREQLRDFYSPLLGMRAEIKAKSELRLKITTAAHETWAKKFEGITDPAIKKQIDDNDSPVYERLFDYNNKQLMGDIVPMSAGAKVGHSAPRERRSAAE
jgi:hypothetical protein